MSQRAIQILIASLAIVGSASCDPGVGGYFAVRPAVPTQDVQADVREALRIAAGLADRYGMSPRERLPHELAAYTTYVYSDNQGRKVLSLWVSQMGDGPVRIAVTEDLTTRWSLKGDSLLHELTDSLNSRFSSRLEEER